MKWLGHLVHEDRVGIELDLPDVNNDGLMFGDCSDFYFPCGETHGIIMERTEVKIDEAAEYAKKHEMGNLFLYFFHSFCSIQFAKALQENLSLKR